MFGDALALAMSAELLASQEKLTDASNELYGAPTKVVTWDVSSRGEVRGDLQEFKELTEQIYNDPRGWRRAGVKFEYVESGAQLHVVLASPQDVVSFSPSGCTDQWSCTVKPYVIINDDRWMGATDSYNSAGADLLDYRRMVMNHETGHWLGHDHLTTCGVNNLAPIMMQQSIDLRGCEANPWPLGDELWTRGV